MKKFKFRLQRLLDVRTVQEKVKLTKLGQEQLRLESEKHKLDLFRKEEEAQFSQIRQEQQRPFYNWTQRANVGYLKRLDRVIRYQTNVISAQEQNVSSARGHYVDAHRRTESLERIHEKKLGEWKTDMLRDEGKQLDEHGSRRLVSGEQK